MKIHLDTDLGGDIDDLCALAMLLKWPGVELIGVTTVAEHQGKRAGYTHYALALAGQDQVPVAAGADVSLGCYRSTPGLPDEARYWPEPVLSKAARRTKRWICSRRVFGKTLSSRQSVPIRIWLC